MSDILINKVAASGLVTIDLEKYYPSEEIAIIDLKEHLFMGLVLKEIDFRSALKKIDWKEYNGKIVLVYCSADAIIPMWSYMLVASYLDGIATKVYNGNKEMFLAHFYDKVIDQIDEQQYTDKRIVIKGCGEKDVPPNAYLKLTAHLIPVVKSIMYGEPCSTVPIYKKKSSI